MSHGFFGPTSLVLPSAYQPPRAPRCPQAQLNFTAEEALMDTSELPTALRMLLARNQDQLKVPLPAHFKLDATTARSSGMAGSMVSHGVTAAGGDTRRRTASMAGLQHDSGGCLWWKCVGHFLVAAVSAVARFRAPVGQCRKNAPKSPRPSGMIAPGAALTVIGSRHRAHERILHGCVRLATSPAVSYVCRVLPADEDCPFPSPSFGRRVAGLMGAPLA